METLKENIITIIKNYPVDKAWIFGSYARQEQNPSSDLDLMVSFRPGSKIGLLLYSHLANLLSEATGKNVDLVEYGFLKDFAKDAAEKEKVLIYERKA